MLENMAHLFDKSDARVFKSYQAAKTKYDAQHEALMNLVAKKGSAGFYEKAMHKNVSAAPAVHVAPAQEVPMLPVRGRMAAPRRVAGAVAPAAPAPAPYDAKAIKALRLDRNVSLAEARRLFREGHRAPEHQPRPLPAQPIVPKPKKKSTASQAPIVEPMEMPEPKKFKKANATMHESSVNANLLSLMWREKKANPALDKKEAMALAKSKLAKDKK
jgi:hypothetical protein